MVKEFTTQERKLYTIWVTCPYPIVSLGLTEALKTEADVHFGSEPPGEEVSLSAILYCANDEEDLSSGVKRLREAAADSPIAVFGMHSDVSLARSALQAGARGFVHAGMQTSQIVRALSVVSEGEIAVPREFLADLIVNEAQVKDMLSPRQQEILEQVCEGLTNAQIAKSLYLSEFTVKQHLRAAYKLLGVRNRTEAARIMQGSA